MVYKKNIRASEHKSESSKAFGFFGRISLCLYIPLFRFAKQSVGACVFVPLCLVFFSGCGQQNQVITTQTSGRDIRKIQTMQAAEDILAQMHFSIEKLDYEEGFIRTRPLSGAQFFEFWRSDNVGAENWIQANIHNIRRTVELYINQNDENPSIDCDVQIQRLSLPNREIPGSAQAYQLFSQSSMLMQTLNLYPEQQKDMAWINLGKDTKLEKEILKRISSIINKESDEGQATRDKL